MRGRWENDEGDFNRAHPFPRVSGSKRGSDIVEGDNTEVRVYCIRAEAVHLDYCVNMGFVS